MDIATCFQACCGGEVKSLSKLTEVTRQELIEDACGQARALGANAIIGVSFQTNTIFEGTIDMILYGTAVKVQK